MDKVLFYKDKIICVIIFLVLLLLAGLLTYNTCSSFQCEKKETINDNSIAIYSIFRVNYPIYKNDIVTPIHAGRMFHHPSANDLEETMIGDDTGDNISVKNDRYSELTAMYWIWKNAPKKNYIGVIYPYRYFINEFLPPSCQDEFDIPCNSGMTLEYLQQLMNKYDIVVPVRHNMGTTAYKAYDELYYISDLNILVDYIKEKYPSMAVSVDNVLNSRYMIEKSMFIMRQDLFDEYMTWMFDILFVLEDKFSHDYRGGKTQTPLYLSEYLFNFWIEYNLSRYKIGELYVKAY